MCAFKDVDPFDKLEDTSEEFIENIDNYFKEQYEDELEDEDVPEEKILERKGRVAYNTMSPEQQKNKAYNKYERYLKGLRYSWIKAKSNVKNYGLKYYEEKYNRLIKCLDDYVNYAKKMDDHKKTNDINQEIEKTKSDHKKFLDYLNPNLVTIDDAKNMRIKITVQGTVEGKGEPRTVNMKSGGNPIAKFSTINEYVWEMQLLEKN